MSVSAMSVVTEKTRVRAANIYMPNHSTRWKDEEANPQRAPNLVQSHTAGKQRRLFKLRSPGKDSLGQCKALREQASSLSVTARATRSRRPRGKET